MTKFKLPVIQENSNLDDLLGEQPLKLNEDLLIQPSWANLLPVKKDPFSKEYISFSELVTWMECGMRHKLKYVDNIRLDEPTEHTEFGKIIHDALQVYLSTKKMPDPKTVIEEVKRRFDLLGNRKELKQKDWEDQVEPILNAVPEFMDLTFPDWEYVGAEVELMEDIEGNNNRKFHGFIDGVIKTPKKARKNSKKTPVGHDFHIIDWKGQRLTSQILTPTGWTTMGSLKVGDKITASNGKTCKVGGIFPLGTKDVYRVSLRDGTFVDCTEDHLWKVSNSNNTTKILTTKELMKKPDYKFLPVLSGPVEFERGNELPIDPYLLGILLGDGCLKTNVRFSTADTEILENIAAVIPSSIEIKKIGKSKYDYDLTVDGKDIDPRVHRNPILNELRKLGLMGKSSYEKFIPTEYLYSSPKERLALLQGLLDTDGWVQKGYPKYSTTSMDLAEGVKHLVGSLGGVTFHSSREKKRNKTEKEEQILTVRLPKGMKPFKLKRKLEKWNPNPKNTLKKTITKIEFVGQDEMQCIGVNSPDHLYVTNDFILTHNTTSWGWGTDKKTDIKKTYQLVLYKHFWSKKLGILPNDIKCGFVLLKRTAKSKERCEYVPVSVGDITTAKALEVLHTSLNYAKKGLYTKNKDSCKFCVYKNTPHCT